MLDMIFKNLEIRDQFCLLADGTEYFEKTSWNEYKGLDGTIFQIVPMTKVWPTSIELWFFLHDENGVGPVVKAENIRKIKNKGTVHFHDGSKKQYDLYQFNKAPFEVQILEDEIFGIVDGYGTGYDCWVWTYYCFLNEESAIQKNKELYESTIRITN